MRTPVPHLNPDFEASNCVHLISLIHLKGKDDTNSVKLGFQVVSPMFDFWEDAANFSRPIICAHGGIWIAELVFGIVINAFAVEV